MARPVTLLICSDLHYAGELEKQRVNYEINAASNPLQRLLLRLYRHHFWLRDPFAHNHLLQRVLHPRLEPDWVIANGDYSCDSRFIGVSDPAACQSARECLGQFRARFGGQFLAVFGDHELGKMSLCGGQGGLRLQSLEIARSELNLEPVWTRRLGRYLLVGVTSSLAAMPVFERETLPEEKARWRELAREHLDAVSAVFDQLTLADKVLLFCHDPTALPFLLELRSVRSRLAQIERTIIGHLHSNLILTQSRILSGLPTITFCGAAIRRISAALSRSRAWRPFNVLLVPSPAGIEFTKRGGYYLATLDPDAKTGVQFALEVIQR